MSIIATIADPHASFITFYCQMELHENEYLLSKTFAAT